VQRRRPAQHEEAQPLFTFVFSAVGLKAVFTYTWLHLPGITCTSASFIKVNGGWRGGKSGRGIFDLRFSIFDLRGLVNSGGAEVTRSVRARHENFFTVSQR
jgi:hypothetical protein